jgi:hypothetical protein
MKRLILFLGLFTFLFLLSGCATETGNIDMTQSTNRTLAVAATVQNSTAVASARQTEVMQDILRATMAADQLRATQEAQALALTLIAESSIQTSTAISQQTEDALNITRTSQALVEIDNQIAYLAQQQQIDIDRRRMLNSILGWTVFLVILAFIAVLSWGFWQFLRASMARRMPPEPQLTPIRVWDRERRLAVMNPSSAVIPPQIVESSFSSPRPRLRSAVRAESPTFTHELTAANIQDTRRSRSRPEIPAAAPWRLVQDEWMGGSLPIGMSAEGMVSINPDTDQHLFIAGMAGSGKTRFALRPLAASAMADGWQVVILDRKGADFTLFREQPNAILIPLGANPVGEITQLLSKIYQEIRRRVDELEINHLQSWQDWGGSTHRILVMIDDFQDVITGITNIESRTELWQLVRSITAEGQRTGMHLAIAVQDPSYTDIDLRIRRYMSPVSFRVSGSLISRVVLNTDGAEALYPRQVMAILNDELVFAFAFAPDDIDIIRFLDDHPHPPLPSPRWLTGTYE